MRTSWARTRAATRTARISPRSLDRSPRASSSTSSSRPPSPPSRPSAKKPPSSPTSPGSSETAGNDQPTLSQPSPLSLDEARQRLRDLGYLGGGVERYLFRRAFAGRGGLFLPAIVLGAFAPPIASLAAVETAEAGFGDSVTAAL